MAGLAQTPRTAARAPEKKKDPALRKAAPTASRPPAYLQRKMALSQPGDKQEQQADHVAQQVARVLKDPQTGTESTLQRASLEPGLKPGPQAQPLARKPVPAAQTVPPQVPAAGPAARKAVPPPKDEHPKVARKAAPGATAESLATPATATPGKEPRVARSAEAQAATPEPPAQVSPPSEGEVDAGTQAQIEARKGGGEPLPEALRAQLEAPFDHAFGGVRIHRDPEANRLATQLQARAFTVGSDIFFASGTYAPDSDNGRELLAHELAHVVQQGGATTRSIARSHQGDGASTIARADTPPAGAAPSPLRVASGPFADATIATTGARTLSLPRIKLPALKRRNTQLFNPLPLHVRQGARPNTRQTDLWRGDVNSSVQPLMDTLLTSARTEGAVDGTAGAETFLLVLQHQRDFLLFGTREELLPRFEIPIWDRHNRATTFQVDHVKEMQLNGEDSPANYELLEASANMGAGVAIAGEIRDKIKGGLEALKTANPAATIPSENRWRWVKDNYDVTFEAIEWGLPHEGSVNGGRAWSLTSLKAGEHISQVVPMPESQRKRLGARGTPTVYASPQGGSPLPALRPQPGWLPRIDLVSWTPVANPGPSEPLLGTLVVDVFKASGGGRGDQISAGTGTPSHSWQVKKVPGLNVGYVSPEDVSTAVRNSLRLPGMSPIQMDSISLTGEGLVGDGRVLPTVPLLQDADIRLRIRGGEAQVAKTFTMEEVHLPKPFEMNACELSVSFGSSSGLGVDGRAEFAVQNLGSGFLAGAASTGRGFALEGGFDFDSRLFDRASITLAYRDETFSGEGDLAITTPNRVRGIRSANLHVAFSEGAVSATGEVQPSIPGVERAGLAVTYSEAEGLLIGGNLQLAPNPAIRSGSVDVTLRKQGDVWKVGATGTATPAIPGVDSQLTVSYDDGAFLAEFRGAFRRGMLDGTVQVGATNRTLGQDGQPTGPATPDSPLIVYGSGSAALRLTPWLQATAGLQFSPNGEVTVAGRIGLPSAIELFARRQVRKPIFNVAVQIPIIPGIVAEVGGNLSATAGFGPGTLEQLELGITYNPAREAETTVTGDARFVIPADAGLRLAARAGIGLGITGASATGGLELGGQLGIDGRAEASAHVVWSPSAGLDLTAQASLSAQPKFKFDVSGYVSVSALGFSVYDNSWQLAAYELGSNLTFGVAFPIHYQEGKPLDVSLDDVTFQVPDVDPGAVIRELADTLF